jgi:hypothetical protein
MVHSQRRINGTREHPEPFPHGTVRNLRMEIIRAPRAGVPVAALSLGLAAFPGSPALAQPATPLEISCPTQAGLKCGVGLVEGGQVLVLHSDGAGWIGKRITLAADGQPYALDAYQGRVLVFEFQGPADPPLEAITTLGNVRLLYVVAPVAP